MRTTLFILIFYLFGFVALGQVEIRQSIHFTSPYDSLRTIKGMSHSVDSLNATTAWIGQQNILNYGVATLTGNDSISLSLSPNLSGYPNGLFLSFLSPITNSSENIRIRNGQLDFKKILNATGKKLDSANIQIGQYVLLIFVDSAFHMVSTPYSPCLNNTVAINENLCIDFDETIAATFYIASKTCGDRNGHLCSWNEWYIACYHQGANLNNMNNNWEWIDDAANNADAAKLVGFGTCNDGTYAPPIQNFAFRCCYRR
ncbi:MAG TPA: hypothetical protein PLR45_00615 [Flavobacteriales bacterium]|nr:hypothetical protein [Flavobacterium sp.]HRE73159.1 hypothetical protein [Flavobacteriales bacterium]HRI47676.1 hypothetical protein [Ignavibacteriaceae bacterium]